MKKVCFYISGFYVGGIESFIRNVIRHMDTEKIQFTILTRCGNLCANDVNLFKNKGVEFFSFDIEHLSFENLLFFRRKLISFFSKKKYDFIHINSINEPFIVKVARKYCKDIAIHIHEPYREEKSKIKNIIKHFVENNNLKFANHFFACSKNTGDAYFQRKGISDYRVINNGIECNDFLFDSLMRDSIRKEYCLNGIVIGHVGRFSWVKNHEFIIELFKRLVLKNPDYTLALVGDGETAEKIKQMVAKSELNKKIVFLGDRQNVCEFLKAFDVFVLPSFYEGLGISLLEAEASGLTCFVSDCIPDEAIITKRVFKEKLSNIDNWVENIEKLDFEYDRRVDNAIMSLSPFNISNTCSQLEEIYYNE